MLVDKQKTLPISHSELLELNDKIDEFNDFPIRACSVCAEVLEKNTASQ
ncbi:hypothetical protein L291_1696 [Acinetobacter guillouiae MSP4-18]|nr:hypothetical protein L291_1696 [Acinetobacter guillouiae MSP4-18]